MQKKKAKYKDLVSRLLFSLQNILTHLWALGDSELIVKQFRSQYTWHDK